MGDITKKLSLKSRTSYTYRPLLGTVKSFSRLYEAYGSQQPALRGTGAQAQELPNLSYTNALILLGVPEEDRAQFISDIDIESMTIRELQQAVC